MAIDPIVHERLSQFGTNIQVWRLEADRLRHEADAAVMSGEIDTKTLVKVESSASVLYDEISSFKSLLAEVGDVSPIAAGQLGTVSDALHVLLLDLTEIGTRLYSLRSGVTSSPS